MRQGTNAIEDAKAACGGDALRIRDELPALIQRGFESLTKVEKDLLKWVGVFELDRLIVGSDGNPEFTNLPRKLNVTITGCLDNCTHCESQDVALVPASADGRPGFNVLVGGKMGSGGFTVASPLDVFVEPHDAAATAAELIRIDRDHGPRDARGECRFSFLIDEWGLPRLRSELADRMSQYLPPAGKDVRTGRRADHLGPE